MDYVINQEQYYLILYLDEQQNNNANGLQHKQFL